jgi:endoglucanase
MKTHPIPRRDFIKSATVIAAGASWAGLPFSGLADGKELPAPTYDKLPRWRGFNLLEKFDAQHSGPFLESDYAWIAELGFNFTRLPLSYRCWSDPSDWSQLREESLKEIDQAVAYGRKYGVHVNLNFHRAPGYCVNPPPEPLSLWDDEKALAACARHWAQFAKRYRGVPNTQVSFDLLNEPADLPEATYRRVVQRLVEAIRQEDPDRLIVADGLKWGTQPVPSLADLKIAQSTRGYAPMRISHHRASWINGSDKWTEPTWPLAMSDGKGYDKARLRRECIQPWLDLQAKGVGVHVGEWGAFNRTPHAVVLAWMRDQLELWKTAGWGWSVWNFRGAFGPLDSDRKDVVYEDFHGHKLDRRMLDLLVAG